MNTQVLQNSKDSKNFQLNGTCKKNRQSEQTAKLLDSELSGALLNSVSSSFNSKQEGRVTAVVAKAMYQEQGYQAPNKVSQQ